MLEYVIFAICWLTVILSVYSLNKANNEHIEILKDMHKIDISFYKHRIDFLESKIQKIEGAINNDSD